MNKKKIVLWGCGRRGEEAYSFLKKNNYEMLAVIDNDLDLQGTLWHGLSVISFKDYVDSRDTLYAESLIIITPVECKAIVRELQYCNIDNYSILNELMSELYDNPMYMDQYNHDINHLQSRVYYELIKNFYEGLYLKGASLDDADPLQMLRKSRHIVISVGDEGIIDGCRFFTNGKVNGEYTDLLANDVDLIILHGLWKRYFAIKLSIEAAVKNISVIFNEDGFIRSILPHGMEGGEYEFIRSHSAIFDINGIYLNARVPSGLECLLNSDQEVSYNEILKAKKIIDKILINKISKYNHQPIYTPDIGRIGATKVLVIDQVNGDKAIAYGLASENTFMEMLEAAVVENPNADILIKSHPQKSKGHYGDINQYSNVYFVDEPINPISLLEYVDKVYVCTSQMGFEACMCGKEVHVFGMPFYAGWGITRDRLTCSRRTRRRNLVEVFYYAYMVYTHYGSYKQNAECDIDTCIDELLEIRSRYFKENSIRCDIK